MDRSELLGETRDALIERGRRAGILRPELLTRAEIVDELVKRAEPDPARQRAARGLLGRARDLIASVVERGLHLPETAEKIRHIPVSATPPPPQPVATVTLAEIYVAQGYRDRALAILDEVLAREPEHEPASALRARLVEGDPPRDRDAAGPVGSSEHAVAAVSAPRSGNGKATAPPMLDDAPLPQRYEVDEVVALPVDPTTAYVYWEVRDDTLAAARSLSAGRLALRVEAAIDGGETKVREIIPDPGAGDTFVYGLPAGARLTVTLGWRAGRDFSPLAAASPAATAHATPAWRVADRVVTWSPDPKAPAIDEPASGGIAVAVAIARALHEPSAPPASDGRAPAQAAPEPPRLVDVPPGGSSDHWAPFGDRPIEHLTSPGG